MCFPGSFCFKRWIGTYESTPKPLQGGEKLGIETLKFTLLWRGLRGGSRPYGKKGYNEMKTTQAQMRGKDILIRTFYPRGSLPDASGDSGELKLRLGNNLMLLTRKD